MSKADARRELQKKLAKVRDELDLVEKFAIENQLEFSFLGMKYFLKDPNGSNRYAKKGIFVSEAEWESSSWGCSGGDSYEEYCAWEEKNFPYEEEDDE